MAPASVPLAPTTSQNSWHIQTPEIPPHLNCAPIPTPAGPLGNSLLLFPTFHTTTGSSPLLFGFPYSIHRKTWWFLKTFQYIVLSILVTLKDPRSQQPCWRTAWLLISGLSTKIFLAHSCLTTSLKTGSLSCSRVCKGPTPAYQVSSSSFLFTNISYFLYHSSSITPPF